MSDTRQKCECERLIQEAYERLEMNVDAKDRGAQAYLNAQATARYRCPVHGKAKS